jgi:hypothetical protein
MRSLDFRVIGAAPRPRQAEAMTSLPTLRTHGARVALTTLTVAVLGTAGAPSASAGIVEPFQPHSTITLAPGIEFAVGSMRTSGNLPQSVRVATVETRRSDVALKSVLSNDLVVKREVVTSMAIRKSAPGRMAMVATNGDMSARERVDAYAAPQSMAVSNGELLLAQACTRPTIGIGPDGDARIGDVRVHVTATPPGRSLPKQIHRVNTHRDDTKTVLFTKRFASSTRTRGGLEVVLQLEDTLRATGSQTVEVLRIRRGVGNTELRSGQAVLSVDNPRAGWVHDLSLGQRFELVTQVVREVDHRCGGTIAPAAGWSAVAEALGGNHFTARNAKLAAPTRSLYPAGVQRHPRTGVGVTADGRVLMVTVDGRRAGSAGVTLAEMGRLMLSLGAEHAINLDGGGSTVMARRILKSGEFRVANRPSDGRQRPATQALVAFEVAAGR